MISLYYVKRFAPGISVLRSEPSSCDCLSQKMNPRSVPFTCTARPTDVAGDRSETFE